MVCIQKERSRRKFSRLILFVAALLMVSGFLATDVEAQSQAVSSEIPDLSGNWDRRGCMPNPGTCPFVFAELPLRARTIGFMDAWDEAAGPKYDCVQATSPSIVVDPYSFQVTQMEDRVIFTYEKDDVVRTIWLEGHGHPEPSPYDFTVQGHAVGRYEGDQLIVITSKFAFDPHGLDDMSNIPSSTLKRVTERYWREADSLKADVITEDAIFLMEPVQFFAEWAISDQPLVLPYACLPELARQPAQFLPSKYQDPGWVRLPAPTHDLSQ